MITFSDSITSVSGIGKKKQSLYKKLGIATVGDLVMHMPRGYFSLSETEAANMAQGEKCVITAKIVKKFSEQRIRDGLSVFKVFCDCHGKSLKLTFFNSKFTVAALEWDREYIFCGTVDVLNLTCIEMTSPIIFPLENIGQLLPIYPLTTGLTQKALLRDVLSAMGELKEYPNMLPQICEKENNLVDLKEAISFIHKPADLEQAKIGLDRVIFEELFLFALNIAIIKEAQERLVTESWKDVSLSEFYSKLEFKPTGAQKRVVEDIIKDVTSTKVMNRMIEGDVGSGKTLVAIIAAFLAVKNGFQASVMAPTETLVLQHLKNFRRILAPFNIECCEVLGSQSKKERNEILEKIHNGSANIIIGTHALLSETTIFKNLGLIVTDEQHRFGVNQRSLFSKKGDGCHSLVMSATPIPRSLSLVLYGDLKLSLIDELPPGRTPIKTYIIGYDKHDRALNFIKSFVEKKKQAYIVCPIIEESEVLNCQSAQKLFYELKSHAFKDISVGFLNGRQTPQEKEQVMSLFIENKISVLVSTTVIEVGVDVPNAVVMMVENAERFGLSQLHQLRGRVGRGGDESYCILATDSKNQDTLERIKVLCNSNDGFFIAEEDLRLRGPGDILGSRQHGEPLFKNADLIKDGEVFEKANIAVDSMLKNPNWREAYPLLDLTCCEVQKKLGLN